MTGRVPSFTILFFLCAFQQTRSLIHFKFSGYTLKQLLHFWTFCSSQVQHKEQLPTYFSKATSRHKSLRSVQEMARESQTSLSFQHGTCPLPATSPGPTGPTSAFLAMQIKKSVLSVTSQVLLCLLTLLSFLQNHFFITSLHLCVMNKSSGLYLTDLTVNSNQVKCSPS